MNAWMVCGNFETKNCNAISNDDVKNLKASVNDSIYLTDERMLLLVSVFILSLNDTVPASINEVKIRTIIPLIETGMKEGYQISSTPFRLDEPDAASSASFHHPEWMVRL